MVSPIFASFGGSTIRHISAWTWCRKTMRRAARPDRGEERHAVPDLHQPVAGAGAADRAGQRGAREDRVAAGLAHHRVAVALAVGRWPGAAAVRMVTSSPALGPGLGHLVGVDLAAAGLGIGEVAPGEQVDAGQPGVLDQCLERRVAAASCGSADGGRASRPLAPTVLTGSSGIDHRAPLVMGPERCPRLSHRR